MILVINTAKMFMETMKKQHAGERLVFAIEEGKITGHMRFVIASPKPTKMGG